MKIVKDTLKNGLKVVIIEMPDSSVVSTSIYVGAGGRYETEENFGISHFLEHMAFKGTHKYPTANDFANAIESIGGKQNAWTSHDHTAFWSIVPKDHRVLAFDTIAEQVSNLVLDEKEIDKERNVIMEEIHMVNDDPANFAWSKFGEVMWPNQAIGSDILGPKENIRKLKREDFVEYLNKHYVAGNMALAVAGGIKAEQVLPELQSTFGQIKPGPKVKPKEIIFDQKEPNTEVFYKNTDQAHVIFGYKTFSVYDKRRYIMDTLVTALGGGMASRLFREIRESRGLAYSVFTVAPDYYSEFGTAPIYAGLNRDRVEEAIKVIKEELDKVKNTNLTDQEIVRAKEFIKGGYQISLENAKNLSNWYAEREFLDPEKPEPIEILKIIDAVTADEIREVACVVFRPERENLLVVGPFKDKQKFDKILKH